MKLYVKKIISLNPNKTKFMSLERAYSCYRYYVVYYKGRKTFEQWLKTEI